MDEMSDVGAEVPNLVSCGICQHEVPLSEAFVPEASDYMVYFCGLDCYAAWQSRAMRTLTGP